MTAEHRHPRAIVACGAPVAPVTTGGELAAARRALESIAERVATIADEAFGPFPIEPIEESLSRIEQGIFAARQRETALEAEVQRLLCFTVGEFVDGEMAPAHRVQFEAHLARCKQCQDEVASLLEVAAMLSGMATR